MNPFTGQLQRVTDSIDLSKRPISEATETQHQIKELYVDPNTGKLVIKYDNKE